MEKTLTTNITTAEAGNGKAKPKKQLSGLDAKHEAQKIAFAPVVFQTVMALRKLGILELICRNRKGISIAEICKQTNVSEYGVRVLLELAADADVVSYIDNDTVTITMTGYFLNSDEMTRVNLNFTNDVCYDGLKFLTESVKNSRPEGLKTLGLGRLDTIYPGLPELSDEVRKAWFEFDHYYSDDAFRDALQIVFAEKPKTLFDVGGNTGKWAFACTAYDKDVHVKIVDLPQQCATAKANAGKKGLLDRISFNPINLLDETQKIPKGADAFWMSQFLDCFSESEIIAILKNVKQASTPETNIYILETFIDNQKFPAAQFCLTATSIYFTCLANGNSKMYSLTAMERLVNEAGLKLVQTYPLIGDSYHTILKLKIA